MTIVQTVLAALALIGLARLSGRVAAFVRQPRVMGEIALGIVALPLLVSATGVDPFSPAVLDGLKTLGDVGLALFVASAAHELKRVRAGGVNRVAAGVFLPSLVAGVAFAVVLHELAGAPLRGDAPTPAFVLALAAVFSVSAVPVLARIVAERRLEATWEGATSLAAAVTADALGWLVLLGAVALAAPAGSGGSLALTAGAGLVAGAAAFAGLRGRGVPHRVRALADRSPLVTALALILLATTAAHAAGLPVAVGAFVAGLAIPARATARVGAAGRVLAPLFFVVTGLALAGAALGPPAWSVAAAATLLAIAAKVGGGYAGARAAGRTRTDGVRLGLLVNTRGLTELVVLDIAYDAGLLAPPLFASLLVMTLVSTAMTGPALDLLERWQRRSDTTPRWALQSPA